MDKMRIIKFKDEYNQDVFLAQKKGWFGWKPLHWTAAWHHLIEHAQEESCTHCQGRCQVTKACYDGVWRTSPCENCS